MNVYGDGLHVASHNRTNQEIKMVTTYEVALEAYRKAEAKLASWDKAKR